MAGSARCSYGGDGSDRGVSVPMVSDSVRQIVPVILGTRPPGCSSGAEAVAEIPDSAVVAAHFRLAPHLAYRDEIYQFPTPFRAVLYGVGLELKALALRNVLSGSSFSCSNENSRKKHLTISPSSGMPSMSTSATTSGLFGNAIS